MFLTQFAHPLLTMLCPQVNSLCLHFCYYLADRFSRTIFLDCICVHVCSVTSVIFDSLQSYGLQSMMFSFQRLLCQWDSPGKKTRVDCHTLLQGIFLTQRLNLHLLPSRWILYPLSPDSIYVCKYKICVFLFLSYFTLYSRLQECLPHFN